MKSVREVFRDPRVKNTVIVMWIIITIGYGIRLYLDIQISNAGLTLQRLAFLKQELKIQNELLENQISSELSLKTVSEKATELGFSKGRVEYLHD